MTWNDGNCNDFKSGKETVCHVPAEYLDGYNTKFGAGSETPVNVRFEESAMGKCGDYATWFFDSKTGKLTISGTGDLADYDYDTVNLPWYAYKDNITSVEIENGVTSIGSRAFYSCKGLKSVTIPDSVTSLGNSAFYNCTGLTSITIPDSVTSIGSRVFWNCTSLTSVTIPDSVTSIGADAFFYCTGLTDVYCYADPKNLTWDDGDCDDFIWNPNHTTVCHVREE